jgi:hypothetical protein
MTVHSCGKTHLEIEMHGEAIRDLALTATAGEA